MPVRLASNLKEYPYRKRIFDDIRFEKQTRLRLATSCGPSRIIETNVRLTSRNRIANDLAIRVLRGLFYARAR